MSEELSGRRDVHSVEEVLDELRSQKAALESQLAGLKDKIYTIRERHSEEIHKLSAQLAEARNALKLFLQNGLYDSDHTRELRFAVQQARKHAAGALRAKPEA